MLDTPDADSAAPAPALVAASGTSLSERVARLDDYAGDPNFMLSLARGLAVLQAFVEQRRPLSVSEAAAATGLPRATVRRCLYTLERMGYAGPLGGGYGLRPPVLGLGEAYLAMVGPSGAIQAILEQLSDSLQETFALGRLHGDDVIWIAAAPAKHALALSGRPGSRMPAFCSSAGRVLLAHLEPAALDTFLEVLTPVRFTPHTKTATADIRAAIEHARRSGYGLNERELDLGVRALAVPVHGRSGEVVAALHVGGATSRLKTVDLLSRFVPEMEIAAREIGLLVR